MFLFLCMGLAVRGRETREVGDFILVCVCLRMKSADVVRVPCTWLSARGCEELPPKHTAAAAAPLSPPTSYKTP